jgi:probable phosphoglycerate mutase
VIHRLLLVRHGVTTWNREGRFQGHLDPPLDPLGELEASSLAARLVSQEAGTPWIVSSPLQRATATAQIVADAFAADGRPTPVQLEPGLMEVAQGAWQGRTHAELEVAEPDAYHAWAATGGLHEPPGGEPVAVAAERAGATIQSLLAAGDGGPAQTLCCVSHGGILSLLAGRLAGMSDEAAWGLHLDNASLSVLERNEGGWRIEAWNDTSHLAAELNAADRRAEGTPQAR